jgi:co-chaperonin GroES (HSP10)
MTLILPKHVAAKLRTQTAPAAARVGGFESAQKHALDTDDFIEPEEVGEQVRRYLAYDGVVPRPVGWRVAVLVLTIPEKSAGGVILVDDSREARSLASPQGVVVGVGETAYKDPARFPENRPWVKVGDRVLFQKYGGRMFQLRTGQHVAILNDTEFAGVVDSGWIEDDGK